MNDSNTISEPVAEMPVLATEPASVPVEPESSLTTGSTPVDMPPEAPESPTNAFTKVLTEDQNQWLNPPESEGAEGPIRAPNESRAPVDDRPVSEPVQSTLIQSVPVSATMPLTQIVAQTESSAQQDQIGFIRGLLVKAQAKIQINKQKKLDKIILFAQKKKTVANEDIQLLLHVSSATATRYLVKLVEQGHLAHVGNPRDAKYEFLR